VSTASQDIILSTPSFKLILRVDEKESIDSTLHYAPPGSSDAFVFVVADLYVHANHADTLVLPRRELGNAMMFLNSFEGWLSSKAQADLSTYIEKGGLAEWVDGYFQRLADDTSLVEDEKNYDRVMAQVMASDNDGIVACYPINRECVLEVMTRRGSSRERQVWWETIDRQQMRLIIQRARAQAEEIIKRFPSKLEH
jgi:hypothetical protein